MALSLAAALGFGDLAAADCNKVYWTDAGAGHKVQRARLCGDGMQDLFIDPEQQPEGIAVNPSAGKVYWADNNLSDIYRGNIDGTGTLELLIDLPREALLCGIALDANGGKMYWAAAGDCITSGKIQRANLDGAGPIEDVVTGIAADCSLALDVSGGKVYWGDHNGVCNGPDSKIRRANLNGTGIEDLVPPAGAAYKGLALDLAAGKMYFTVWFPTTGSIRRADLDGTDVQVLVTDLVRPTGITLDVSAGKMYWAAEDAGKIQRSNLDGTGVEDIICPGVSNVPFGVALDTSVGSCGNCCGDGVVNLCSEQCDDGNTASGDGCSAACLLESPTPTRTRTPTTTSTHTRTTTATVTPTRTATITPTITLTPTRTATVTPTITLTPTRTATITPTITLTPTRTATITPTITLTPTRTAAITPTITLTPLPTCEAVRCAVEPIINAQCACESATNHGSYVRCVGSVLKQLVHDGAVPRNCRGKIRQCAARSTCGKPGAVACLLKNRCSIKSSDDRCTAAGGTASPNSSCCMACPASTMTP